MKLAGILAQPDESMDSDLVEALHVIGSMGTDESRNDNHRHVDGQVTFGTLASRWGDFSLFWTLLEARNREISLARKAVPLKKVTGGLLWLTGSSLIFSDGTQILAKRATARQAKG
ncbi:MAG: hypothetical protein HY647_11105 [Acidobacteria bacterium]|nr:hypothetical protein [Acidobacteriota bacterium]